MPNLNKRNRDDRNIKPYGNCSKNLIPNKPVLLWRFNGFKKKVFKNHPIELQDHVFSSVIYCIT